MIESIQQQDLTIPVGGMQEIHLQGDRFDFLSASTDPFAVIEVKPDYTAGAVQLRPGQGFKFSGVVKRWVVYNRGTVPLAGIVLIGAGDFQDRRITGDVNVIDNAKSRTLSGMVGTVAVNIGGAAGAYTKAGIWNPAGSGRTVTVKKFYAGSGVSQVLYPVRVGSVLASQGTPKPVLLDGSAFSGVSKITYEATAAAAGSGNFTNTLGSLYVSASQNAMIEYPEPFVIKPGFGLVMVCSQANTDLTVMMPFFEEVE